MYLPQPTEGNFDPVPAGTHLGICFRVIDLGTQVTTYAGEQKRARKIMISWEIPDEKMTDGRPFVISQMFTWSMHEKSTLRKSLEAWRGAAFTDADFRPPTAFDIKNILGKACTLSVTHNEKGDRTYANIASVGKLMKGAAVPALVNAKVYLWLSPDRWNEAAFNGLSLNLRTKISATPEYVELQKQLNVAPPDEAPDEEIPLT
jgi:hypothetical protein